MKPKPEDRIILSLEIVRAKLVDAITEIDKQKDLIKKYAKYNNKRKI